MVKCCGEELRGYLCPVCDKDHRGEKPKEMKLVVSDSAISFDLAGALEEHRKIAPLIVRGRRRGGKV